MFFAYCLILLLLVYLAPALALYPRLLLRSRTAVAIPFVSIAAVTGVYLALAQTGTYSQAGVRVVSIIFLAIALIRIGLVIRKDGQRAFDWPVTHRVLVLFSVLLGIYPAADLGTSGFDSNDEIYSWNMWAVQHYLGHEIDFYYTGSPYPQLFSILISYCYLLLGSVELQMPVKTLFALFPIALWSLIGVAPQEPSAANAIRSIAALLLLNAAIGRYFTDGLADPLMAAALITAIYLYMQYTETTNRRDLLVLSVICGTVAVYTKQAALIWAVFSFPAITLFAVAQRRLPAEALVAAAMLLVTALIWLIGPGSGFYNNQGVIDASQHGRGTLEQLFFAGNRHFTKQPLLLLFRILGLTAVIRARRYRDIYIFFLLPALLAWLLFGAYSLRLGIHVVALSALLIAATSFALPLGLAGGSLTSTVKFVGRHRLALAIFALLLVFTASANRVYKGIRKYGEDFAPYLGGKNAIVKYFGKDSKIVFEKLYDRPDVLLWIPSNYIYGIFYGHTEVMRPSYQDGSSYTPLQLISEIEERSPDFLFDAGHRVSYGPGSATLRKVAEEYCPGLFEKVATPPNKHGYTVYRLHDEEEELYRCRKTITR